MKYTGKLYFWLTLLLIGSLLFSYKLNSLCIILLLVTWLIEGDFREKARRLVSEPFFVLNALLFLFYIISIKVSADSTTARFFVEKNLSLLVLPLVFLSKKRFTATETGIFCKTFVAGTLLLMSLALIKATLAFGATGDSDVFFYHRLAEQVGISAIIASLHCVVSVGLLFYLHINSRVRWVAITVFGLFVLLLLSKLFLLVLFLLVLVNTYPLVSGKIKIAVLSASLLLLLVITFTANPVRKRFEDMGKFQASYLSATAFNPGMYFDGLSLRLLFVRFGLEIMQEKGNYLLGVGTGDAETLLKQKIIGYNMYQGDGVAGKQGYLQFGYHNQFLQKLVQLGITGFVLFISGIIYCLIVAKKYGNKMLGNLVLIFTFSFFTDTLLEHQVGLVMFLTFASMGISEIRRKQDSYNEDSLAVIPDNSGSEYTTSASDFPN